MQAKIWRQSRYAVSVDLQIPEMLLVLPFELNYGRKWHSANCRAMHRSHVNRTDVYRSTMPCCEVWRSTHLGALRADECLKFK